MVWVSVRRRSFGAMAGLNDLASVALQGFDDLDFEDSPDFGGNSSEPIADNAL